MRPSKIDPVQGFADIKGLSWEPPSDAMKRWAASPAAASAVVNDTITIFDQIGQDPWSGEGFTAKRMEAALRSIGQRDVRVQINSPGGSLFEGVTIFNLLRKHNARVSVEVLGIAASAASLIAMAGDELVMGEASFLMVHNAWGITVGNRHDMREAADLFEQLDGAMAKVYAERSGKQAAEIHKIMDEETFFNAEAAVAFGLADRVDGAIEAPKASAKEAASINAKRQIDLAMAKAGLPRSERRRLFNDISGTQDAAEPATQDAGDIEAALKRLCETISKR